jgi:hypothetical protein
MVGGGWWVVADQTHARDYPLITIHHPITFITNQLATTRHSCDHLSLITNS